MSPAHLQRLRPRCFHPWAPTTLLLSVWLLSGCAWLDDPFHAPLHWVGLDPAPDVASPDEREPLKGNIPPLGGTDRPKSGVTKERDDLIKGLAADRTNAIHTQEVLSREGNPTRPLNPDSVFGKTGPAPFQTPPEARGPVVPAAGAATVAAPQPAAPAVAASNLPDAPAVPAAIPSATVVPPPPLPSDQPPAPPPGLARMVELAKNPDAPEPAAPPPPPVPPAKPALAIPAPAVAPAPAPAPAPAVAPAVAPAPALAVAAAPPVSAARPAAPQDVEAVYRRRLAESNPSSGQAVAALTAPAVPTPPPANTQIALIPPAPGHSLAPTSSGGAFRPLSAFSHPGATASLNLGSLSFGEGTAALAGSADSRLAEIARLSRQTGGNLRIVGRSASPRLDIDARGNLEANRQLAQQRADTVARALVRLGVAPRQLFTGPADDPAALRLVSSPGSGDTAEIYLDY